MRSAWACRFRGLAPDQAELEIHQGMTRPPKPRDEVATAVGKVYGVVLESRVNRLAAGQASPRKWPTPDPKEIQAIASGGLGVVDLWERSPIRFHDDRPHAAEILARLFPGNPLLCVGSTTKFFTAPLGDIAGAADAFELIVASPMSAEWGRAVAGHLSMRTKDNTGPRRFLVVEGDRLDGEPIPKDTQAAVLFHLAEIAPLALVVDSGGKSLHGWFRTHGHTELQAAAFFRRACTLGADSMLWGRAQFARMPGGLRDNGNRQHILFFNPKALP